MSEYTHYIVSGEGLLDNYQIHYTFDDYTGISGSYFINNDAKSLYSGKVNAISTSSDSTDPFDYFTGNGQITGQGVFSGGLNEFYHSIDVQDISGLNTGNSNQFTFIIAAETTSLQDVGESDKGPVTNNNILFSNFLIDNYSGDCNKYYGFEIGINSANRAYVETYNNLMPRVLTYSNEKMPYNHNIWAVIHRAGRLLVGLYDIKEESFVFDACAIDGDSFNSGSEWNIGSGVLHSDDKFTSQITYNSGLFAGKISDFVYFDDGISNAQAGKVAKSLYSDLYTEQAESSESVNTGVGFGILSTGSNDFEDEVSLSGDSSVLTVNSNFSYVKKEELTGTINSGELQYQLVATIPHEVSGTEGVYKAVYHTGSAITGITGFQDVTYVSGISRDYNETNETSSLGNLLTGISYTISSETGSSATFTLSDSISGLSGSAPELFRPNSLTYTDDNFIDSIGSGNIISEIYRADSFEIANKDSLNNTAGFGRSSLSDGRSVYLKNTTDQEELSLYIGKGYELGDYVENEESRRVVVVDRESGIVEVITDCGVEVVDISEEESQEYIEYYRNYEIASGDFVLSGLEVIDNHVWIGDRGKNLNAIYDLNQPTGYISGDYSRWVITGQQDFIDNPSSIFDSNDEQLFVFLNGQKLVSGVDYSGGFSTWAEHISGETTGVIFLRPNVSDSLITGSYPQITGQYFWPNGNLVFFNGVRQDYKKYFIEHSNTKDLISSGKFSAPQGSVLYNNVG